VFQWFRRFCRSRKGAAFALFKSLWKQSGICRVAAELFFLLFSVVFAQSTNSLTACNFGDGGGVLVKSAQLDRNSHAVSLFFEIKRVYLHSRSSGLASIVKFSAVVIATQEAVHCI
jgi:hypothetical protein